MTGHRSFEPGVEQTLKARVQAALGLIRTKFDDRSGHGVTFTVVSPLAEGADRIVADVVLSTLQGRLEAVLPFRDEIYLEDFELESSKSEFRELLALASVVVYGPELRGRQEQDPEERNKCYEWVGRYVVDHSDVVIALWNGEAPKGTGGTAEIIRYALERSRSIVYIPTNGGEMVECFADDEVSDVFLPTGFSGRHL